MKYKIVEGDKLICTFDTHGIKLDEGHAYRFDNTRIGICRGDRIELMPESKREPVIEIYGSQKTIDMFNEAIKEATKDCIIKPRERKVKEFNVPTPRSKYHN